MFNLGGDVYIPFLFWTLSIRQAILRSLGGEPVCPPLEPSVPNLIIQHLSGSPHEPWAGRCSVDGLGYMVFTWAPSLLKKEAPTLNVLGRMVCVRRPPRPTLPEGQQ